MLRKGLLVRRFPAWVSFLLLAVVFGVSYGQYPLHYLAQNQYFFHGLAKGGFGLLRSDWLINTADSWPVFTQLVYFTSRYLDHRVFYFYFILLAGVYAYSLVGIASSLFRINAPRSKLLVYVAVVTALHSSVLGDLLARTLGFNAARVLVDGVASQRILWDMFQPGAFGALLLLSIYLFLRGRPFLSIAASCLAATVHPTYILSAAVLTMSYIVIMLRRREGLGRTLGLGVCALGLVVPILAYVFIVFRPTAPDIWPESRAILVHYRLTRHTDLSRWFGWVASLKVAMAVVATYVVRRTEFLWVLLLSTMVAVGLTVAQVLSGSDALALLFPWRLSVWLVPLSISIILACAISWLHDELGRRVAKAREFLVALSVVALVVCVGAGAIVMARRFGSRVGIESVSVMAFVKAGASPKQVYLIPVQWRNFRLSTGAPTFVEYWFVPYNDAAVVEWRRRIRLAEVFYGSGGDERCRIQRELSANYKVTHAVLRGNDSGVCDAWKLLSQDGNSRLYLVTP